MLILGSSALLHQLPSGLGGRRLGGGIENGRLASSHLVMELRMGSAGSSLGDGIENGQLGRFCSLSTTKLAVD
jgi:hypothetical protein